MVDTMKETLEFLKGYGCSPVQARKAALLSKELCENQSDKILALNKVLLQRGYNMHTTAVLSIKLSALAIWKFTNYRPIKQSAKKYAFKDDKNAPNLTTSIYPLTAMVLELKPDNVTTELRSFAKRHARGKFTPRQLIFAVLYEAMQMTESTE